MGGNISQGLVITSLCFYSCLWYGGIVLPMTTQPPASDLPASSPVQDDSEPWNHRIGHLLWAVEARVSLLGEAELGDTPLTLPAVGLLDMVSAFPGSTVSEISRRTPKTQQAISQVASRLEKLGYLERRLGPGRGVGLYITDAGTEARKQGHRREEVYERKVRELFGEERFLALKQLLEEARELLEQ
jgi:DNA-binding MarR family transcriptional regulator